MTQIAADRLDEILAAIRQLMRTKQSSPTVREIGELVGIASTSQVNYYLGKLENQGRIRREHGIARGIRLVEDHMPRRSDGVVDIPMAGFIFASKPVLVGDTSQTAGDETYPVARELVRDMQAVFALRVRGDSMIDALVNEGDVVVLRKVDQAKNGDVVAVWLKDRNETTLKRFFLEGNRVRLQPANPTLQPIWVDPAQVEIQGKVILVVRQPT